MTPPEQNRPAAVVEDTPNLSAARETALGIRGVKLRFRQSESIPICYELIKRNVASLNGDALQSELSKIVAMIRHGEGDWFEGMPSSRKQFFIESVTTDRLKEFRGSLKSVICSLRFKSRRTVMEDLKKIMHENPNELSSKRLLHLQECIKCDADLDAPYRFPEEEGGLKIVEVNHLNQVKLRQLHQAAYLLDNMYCSRSSSTESPASDAVAKAVKKRVSKTQKDAARQKEYIKRIKKTKRQARRAHNRRVLREHQKDKVAYALLENSAAGKQTMNTYLYMYGQSHGVDIPDHVKAGMSATNLSVSAPVAPDIDVVSDTTVSAGEEEEDPSSPVAESREVPLEEREEEEGTLRILAEAAAGPTAALPVDDDCTENNPNPYDE